MLKHHLVPQHALLRSPCLRVADGVCFGQAMEIIQRRYGGLQVLLAEASLADVRRQESEQQFQSERPPKQ
jgi:hypothetical protein